MKCIRLFLAAGVLLGGALAQAKDGIDLHLPGVVYLGVGGGNTSITSPSSGISGGSSFAAQVGYDGDLFGTGLGIDVNGTYLLAQGKLDYDYTNGATNYTESNKKFSVQNTEIDGGAHLRFLNLGVLRSYVKGGGLWGTATFAYDKDSTLDAIGSTYVTSDSGIKFTGYYYAAGVEFFPGNVGLRVEGRMSHYDYDAVPTFKKQKVSMNSPTATLSLVYNFDGNKVK